MSKIMERAENFAVANGATLTWSRPCATRDALQAEVTRMETEIACLRKEAMVKHEYEEAAEFYAECGPGPDQLKSWIIDTKKELAELRDKLAAIEAQQPVGEVMTLLNGKTYGVIYSRKDRIEGKSLYLAAGAKPALVPMTGEDIDEAYLKHQDGPYERAFTAGIKAAEAHHKIGAKP